LFEGPGHYVPNFLSLVLWFLAHYFLLPLVLTAPVPSGISLPLIAIGGAFGRLVGKYAVAQLHGTQVAAGYALVGGAGLLSGVTQAYSSTIIVMEMTGQLEYLFPSLISVVIAVMTSRALGISIFERIVLDKKLPYLPRLKVHQYR
jgi:chloride channel 2